MGSLNCSDCDGAGCIPEDSVYEQMHELARLMRSGPMQNWSDRSRELIDRWSACPVSAGYAIYALTVVDFHQRQLRQGLYAHN